METIKRSPKGSSERNEDRLRFETLLAEISSRYINLPIDQVDSMIEDDQRRICEFLGLDLSTLWQWEDGSSHFITLTHLYTVPGGPARPERLEAQKSFPCIQNSIATSDIFLHAYLEILMASPWLQYNLIVLQRFRYGRQEQAA